MQDDPVPGVAEPRVDRAFIEIAPRKRPGDFRGDPLQEALDLVLRHSVRGAEGDEGPIAVGQTDHRLEAQADVREACVIKRDGGDQEALTRQVIRNRNRDGDHTLTGKLRQAYRAAREVPHGREGYGALGHRRLPDRHDDPIFVAEEHERVRPDGKFRKGEVVFHRLLIASLDGGDEARIGADELQ